MLQLFPLMLWEVLLSKVSAARLLQVLGLKVCDIVLHYLEFLHKAKQCLEV